VRLTYYLYVRRESCQFLPRKYLLRDLFQPIQAFAQPGTDRLGVQLQRAGDFLVAQISKITQFDDFTARLIELVQRFVHQSALFTSHQGLVRPWGRAWQVEDPVSLRVFSLNGNGYLAAAAFSRVLPLAIIPRFVGGDPNQPGLKLAFTVERF